MADPAEGGMVMKKMSVGLAIILALVSGLLGNGLNLNGFGARAVSMGGAFVGLADDFTAVFWNPAGLVLLSKGTFGLTGELLVPKSKYFLNSSFDMKTKNKYYPAGLVGYFQPVGDRVVVGLGAYTLSGLGADWNNTGFEAALAYPTPPTFFTPPLENYPWRSFIGSITLAPSVAVKIADGVFFGATLNINYGFFQTDQWGTSALLPTKPPTLVNLGQQSLDIKGWGTGATFGLLVKPSEWMSFGLTYRTQSKMKLRGTMAIENIGLLGLPASSETRLDVPSPTWLAGGVAVKTLENLTVTFDLQWTNWAKLSTLNVVFDEPSWTAALADESAMVLDWKNRLQVRGGLEYTAGDFAVRAGYYHDPAPAPAETMNVLIPSFTFNSLTAGFGYKKGGFKVDVGLEYLIGQKRTVTEGMMPGVYEMKIWVPMLALGYGW
jgi:long-chain fatty acid transport protein